MSNVFLWLFSIRLKKFLSVSSLLQFFKITNQYWILSDALFCVYHNDHIIFFLLTWWMNYFQMSNHHCTPKINCTWLWCIMLFIYPWTWFVNILFRIFAFVFKRESINFPFKCCSCGVLISMLCWPHKVIGKCSLIF